MPTVQETLATLQQANPELTLETKVLFVYLQPQQDSRDTIEITDCWTLGEILDNLNMDPQDTLDTSLSGRPPGWESPPPSSPLALLGVHPDYHETYPEHISLTTTGNGKALSISVNTSALLTIWSRFPGDHCTSKNFKVQPI